jgi:uncharacterized protein YggL (DUF469 family)
MEWRSMKKRLRKKKFRGEFAVLGFACTFRLQPPLTSEEADSFFDEFIAHIEKSDLLFAGGANPSGWDGVMQHRHPRSSATQSQREAIAAWLGQRPNVREVKVGRLTDLHYGFEEER